MCGKFKKFSTLLNNEKKTNDKYNKIEEKIFLLIPQLGDIFWKITSCGTAFQFCNGNRAMIFQGKRISTWYMLKIRRALTQGFKSSKTSMKEN